MKVELTREEILAALIALEREKKPGGWAKSAIAKLDRALAEVEHE